MFVQKAQRVPINQHCPGWPQVTDVDEGPDYPELQSKVPVASDLARGQGQAHQKVHVLVLQATGAQKYPCPHLPEQSSLGCGLKLRSKNWMQLFRILKPCSIHSAFIQEKCSPSHPYLFCAYLPLSRPEISNREIKGR